MSDDAESSDEIDAVDKMLALNPGNMVRKKAVVVDLSEFE